MLFKIGTSDIIKATGLTGGRLLSHQRRKKALIKLVLRWVPANSSILDLGCASGDIAVELSLRGYDLFGLEIEPERLLKARELAKKYKAYIRFSDKKIENFKPDKKFDAIILGEILEHFYHPAELLCALRNISKPDVKLIISTPNMPSLRNRLKFGIMGIFPDNNPEHKYYFDRRRFSALVDRAEFRILFFQTRFTEIFKRPSFFYLERIFLFWFSMLFKNSGDTLFAIVKPSTGDRVNKVEINFSMPHRNEEASAHCQR